MGRKVRIPHRLVGAAVAAALLVGALAGPASASLFHLEFPAGQACSYALAVDGDAAVGGSAWREWTDADGNTVRTLFAGTGYALTYTNLATGDSLSLPSNGAVTNTRILADGTQVVASMGHNLVILFPSDVPAGPSTTLYVGRVTYTVSTAGVFTIQSSSGTRLDICAALD